MPVFTQRIMDETIRALFHIGLSYNDILISLARVDGTVVSMRTLKRVLRRLGLFRRLHYSDFMDITLFILSEVEKSGQLHGYKMMHQKCILQKYVVTQETVRHILRIIDPIGVEIRQRNRLRRRKYNSLGPNFLWHFDGYDKLKPYGFCINGAIDGFSRYIVWLECYTTNSDPKVIAGYFMKSVQELEGSPARIRCDKGTENGDVLQMQMFMRHTGEDQYAQNSCLVGASTHNQRIEQWWGFLRKENAQYWMNLFGLMKDTGCFDGTFLDKALLQYCFMDLIQVNMMLIVH